MLCLARGVFLFSAFSCVFGGAFHECSAQLPDAGQPKLPPVLLQMTRDPAVWKELELTPEQIGNVQRTLDEIDGDWWRSRVLPPAEQATKVAALTETLRRQLSTVLEPAQVQRLAQLERQGLGTRMLLLDDVAAVLGLESGVRQRLTAIALSTDQRAADLQKQAGRGEAAQSSSLDQELQKLQDRERQDVLKQLSRAQQQQVSVLAGKRFDFQKVQRTLPRAPELVDADGSWLQGDAATRRLSDLRGQVVVLHFYAFQCINCKRNLPHYLAWHRDYADQGLVVIGVQTPETPAERDADKVRAAVEAEQIPYPVLFDSASTNWQNWGTTMWPTVYLIDRNGYIRTWWQGELNWEGATGEQQLRKHIETLLAEPAPALNP